MPKKRWLLPVIILLLFILLGLTRWHYTASTTYTHNDDYRIVAKFKHDRWTGAVWQEYYAAGTRPIAREILATPEPAEGGLVIRESLTFAYWFNLFIVGAWIWTSLFGHALKVFGKAIAILAIIIATLMSLLAMLGGNGLWEYQGINLLTVAFAYYAVKELLNPGSSQ